jgi:predicted HAD superfamily Cof-like phosphohydrolase
MANFFEDVKEFQTAFKLPVGDRPHLPKNEDERQLRIKLLEEEFNEYLAAEVRDDLVEVADALADIIYIACGTAVSYGIPLDKVFAEVHRSNMAKLVDGKPIYREDGKVMKPQGWQPPNIERILELEKHESLMRLITPSFG